jgi:hypothetical protein
MPRLFIALLLILASPAAFAQAYYAQQDYPAPSNYVPPAQVTGNAYAGQPVYAPQEYMPPAQPAPQPAARGPLPSDYGQSVMTDIRQMNF